MLSAIAEIAQTDIRLVAAEHRRNRNRSIDAVGRILGDGPGPAERNVQLLITTIVAVTENYATTRLEGLGGATQNDVRNWQTREAAWLRLANVVLGNCAHYQKFRGWNEARNAIMHGQGILTKMQTQASWAADVRHRLAAAGVRMDRSRVLVNDEDLERCASTCWAFVGELDTAAP